MTHLCITVRWLDDRYHGLVDRGGPPEWPPSPYRLFQALVAGVARREGLDSDMGSALGWLQTRSPVIVATRSRPGRIATRFVPNNDSDRVLDRQNRLTAKVSQPSIMLDRPEVHYVWPIDGDDCPHRQLIDASRNLSCLGWGIDMAYADGRLLDAAEVRSLNGVYWYPRAGTFREDGMLRVPKEGSMADLRRAHESALNRIEPGKPLKTVHKPQVFDRVFYASAERPLGRPFVAFALRTTSGDSYNYPHAKLIHIAGMTRRAAIKVLKECPPEGIADRAAWVGSFVAGHHPDGAKNHEQFSYIPLPSIGHDHADAMIRRVMIVAPQSAADELAHLAGQLDSVQLEPEDGGVGPILWRLRPDGVTRSYLAVSRAWASVTPVILPGHDDHKPEKTARLIQRALQQSGIDQPCRFTWSALPNFSHCLSAHRYDQNKRPIGYYRPGHLESLTAVHVRITFVDPVAGPVSVGSGRHCGLGILASVDDR